MWLVLWLIQLKPCWRSGWWHHGSFHRLFSSQRHQNHLFCWQICFVFEDPKTIQEKTRQDKTRQSLRLHFKDYITRKGMARQGKTNTTWERHETIFFKNRDWFRFAITEMFRTYIVMLVYMFELTHLPLYSKLN